MTLTSGGLQRETLAVELEQLEAPARVGQRQLDRLVNPPRALRERLLQALRPVIGALALELDGQRRDLQLEVVDELQTGVDVAPPRVRDRHAVKQLAAGQPEQI